MVQKAGLEPATLSIQDEGLRNPLPRPETCKLLFQLSYFCVYGGRCGIRTHVAFTPTGFQNQLDWPLRQPSLCSFTCVCETRTSLV